VHVGFDLVDARFSMAAGGDRPETQHRSSRRAKRTKNEYDGFTKEMSD